jgi:hypothetical protein
MILHTSEGRASRGPSKIKEEGTCVLRVRVSVSFAAVEMATW